MHFTRHLQVAGSVGLVGGFVLGCREAIVSLQANAAVQPDQYLFVYVAVPILAWTVLAPLLLLPFAFICGALWQWSQRRSLSLCVGALTAVGVLSATMPALASASTLVLEVGGRIGLGLRLLVWAVAVALAGAGAMVTASVAASYEQWIERYLPRAAAAVSVVALILLWPVARFFVTDWKWGLRPAEARPATTSPEAEGYPNILLISIDTLRADHLGSSGDPHGLTPNLDRFAQEGVSFSNATTASPWTLPAMASLFTAQYPRHHGAGVITNRRTPLGRSALPPQTWTLTHALHAHGFRTHAIVTNPYLALRYGFGEDFDTYENITVESEAFVSFAQTTALRVLAWLWPSAVIGDRGATVSQRAVTLLRRFTASPADQRTGAPFFLWLHYIDPHPPYSRPGATEHKSMRGDLSLSDSGETGETLSRLTLTSPDVARLRSGEIRLSGEEEEAVRGLYRAEVRSVDEAVGQVLDALDHTGLREHTLVVVVGDHGEEFWEHGGVEHGRTVYDEVVRIPLLMRWPGRLPASARVDALARITDVAPTVLDLLGLAVPGDRDGESLVPVMHGEPAVPRVTLIENMLFAEERIGIRTTDRKYVLWENGKEEVYDLGADPRERIDLAGVDGALAQARETYARLNSNGKSVAPATSLAPEITSGTAEALRALGYLD